MAWEIELSGLAIKNLDNIHKNDAERILRFLFERLARLDDPRSIGEDLRGARLGALWKYRVGDFRVIADIEDRLVKVVVVRTGNRRDIYR